MTKTLKKTAATFTKFSSTREAVESAIDFSKNNREITWEQGANRKLGKISKWGGLRKPNQATAGQ